MARNRLRTSPPATSANRLALAVTLGMVIGLIPKDSAIGWGIMAVAIMLPIPLLATLATALACTFLGLCLDAWTDPLGFWLLTTPSLSPVWTVVNVSPPAAWLRLNNSVTVGSLALALLATLPTYLATGWLARLVDRVWINDPPRREPLIPTLVTELDR